MSGWNKPTGKPVETKKAAKPAFKHVLIASGVVAVLGCVLLLVFSGGDGAPKAKAEKKAGVIKEVKPAKAPRVEPSQPKKQTETVKPRQTNMWVRVEKLANGDEKRWTANGDCYYVDMSRSREEGHPTFTNDVEATLAMYVYPGKDMPPPPTDDISDEEALAACNIPLYAFPTDPDEVLDQREAVEHLKKELKQYIEEGGHAKDFIQRLIDRQEAEAEYVEITKEEVMKLVREDDCSTAKELLKRMNARLGESGIPPVKLETPYQRMLDEMPEPEEESK